MFLGEYEYKIDEKGRVPIPPKFRRDLKDGVVVTVSPEKCLVAYSISTWNKLSAELTKGGLIANSKQRRLNRAIFSAAFSLQIDSQGRIALPAKLRDYAGIMDEVVITGVNTHMELWDTTQWETEKAASQEQAWQIIESLEQR